MENGNDNVEEKLLGFDGVREERKRNEKLYERNHMNYTNAHAQCTKPESKPKHTPKRLNNVGIFE